MNTRALFDTNWSATFVLARREATSSLAGLAPFVALTLALLAAVWMLSIDVRALDGAGLLVPAGPFRAPLQAALLILAAFFAVTAAVSTARERESGTLEVLFYGPVDEFAYVLGKAGGVLLAYAAMLPILALAFALLSLASGFALDIEILAGIALSLLPAAEIIAFAVLLSIGTNRIRTAVLLFVGVTILFLGITLAYGIVLMIPIADPSSAALPLRDALVTAEMVVRWLSPFAYLERIVSATAAGNAIGALADIVTAMVLTLLMLALSALWLAHRGVERRGE